MVENKKSSGGSEGGRGGGELASHDDTAEKSASFCHNNIIIGNVAT